MCTRGLTEEACQKWAAEYNQGRWGGGWRSYCAVSFSPREAEPRVRAYHLRSAAGSQAGLMKTFTLVVWLYVGGGRHEAM